MTQQTADITEVNVYNVGGKAMFVALPVEHTFASKENMTMLSMKRLAG